MFAAAANRAATIRRLVEGGADPSIETNVVDVLQHLIADRDAARYLRRTIQNLRHEQGGEGEWEPSADQIQEAIRQQRAYLDSGEPYRDYEFDELVSYRPDYPGGPDVPRPPYRETLVGKTGGMTALLFAAREGNGEAVTALLDGGADIDQVSAGDAVRSRGTRGEDALKSFVSHARARVEANSKRLGPSSELDCWGKKCTQ